MNRRDESLPDVETSDDWPEAMSQQLEEQTSKAEEFTEKWNARLVSIEKRIEEQLGELSTRFAAEEAELQQGEETLRQREKEFLSRAVEIEQLKKELDDERQRLARASGDQKQLQEELGQRKAKLEQLAGGLNEERQTLEAERAAADEIRRNQLTELENRRRELEELGGRLKDQEDVLRRRGDETSSQRRRLALQLKAQRKEQLAEVAEERLQLQQQAAAGEQKLLEDIAGLTRQREGLQEKLTAAEEQLADLREQLAQGESALEEARRQAATQLEEAQVEARQAREQAQESVETAGEADEIRREFEENSHRLKQREGELEQLRQELSEKRKLLATQEEKIEGLRRQRDEARESSSVASAASTEENDDLEALKAERDELIGRLAQAEVEAKKLGQQLSESNMPVAHDLRRRFEMAVEDVRQLKEENAKLRIQLKSGEKADSVALLDSAGPDWETQKRRMLARLEADQGDAEAADSQERLTIEGTLQITDQMIAEKDRQIEELQKRLARSTTVESPPEADDQKQEGERKAAKTAQLLDADHLISQERENLRRLQDEWKEKLRKAEIDISLERAKLARERSDLEEQLQSISQQDYSSEGDASSGGGKGRRSRWLVRLGLADENE